MLDGFHELEFVRKPQGRGQSDESTALVQGGEGHRNVEEECSDAKTNLED